MVSSVIAGYPMVGIKVIIFAPTHDVDSNEMAFKSLVPWALKKVLAADPALLEPYVRRSRRS